MIKRADMDTVKRLMANPDFKWYIQHVQEIRSTELNSLITARDGLNVVQGRVQMVDYLVFTHFLSALDHSY